jgi:hypothetical protein
LKFGVDKVFMDAEEISVAPAWGLRLAWSRLVDLGSIDSGSNPGGPTNLHFWIACFSIVVVGENPLYTTTTNRLVWQL